jgi:hypothetical protein
MLDRRQLLRGFLPLALLPVVGPHMLLSERPKMFAGWRPTRMDPTWYSYRGASWKKAVNISGLHHKDWDWTWVPCSKEETEALKKCLGKWAVNIERISEQEVDMRFDTDHSTDFVRCTNVSFNPPLLSRLLQRAS